MEDLNLIIVNSLNICRKQFFDKSIQVYLNIGPPMSKRFYPFRRSIKFKNLISYMDTILDFMASSHSMESGPIIASLFVVGSLLFNNNSSSSNLLFDYVFNQTYKVQQILRSPGLQHFVDTRAMRVVAISRTASGAALLCSSCLGSITSSNSIVLPLKLLRENSFSKISHSATKQFAVGFIVEGIPS